MRRLLRPVRRATVLAVAKTTSKGFTAWENINLNIFSCGDPMPGRVNARIRKDDDER
jgi:hypothetical protein